MHTRKDSLDQKPFRTGRAWENSTRLHVFVPENCHNWFLKIHRNLLKKHSFFLEIPNLIPEKANPYTEHSTVTLPALCMYVCMYVCMYKAHGDLSECSGLPPGCGLRCLGFAGSGVLWFFRVAASQTCRHGHCKGAPLESGRPFCYD